MLLLLLIFSFEKLFAQDFGRQQQQIDSVAVKYLQTASRYSVLYYGEQQLSPLRTSNHPYLNDIQFAKASLSYHGVLYPEVLLRFDISRSELIIMSPNYLPIVLYPEYVDFAELHGKHIIYFRNDSLSGSPSTGYYYLLHSGKCRVLEKNNAALRVKSQYDLHYIFSKRFFLYHAEGYYTIKNKRTLLKVLQPYKKELKLFISSNQLRFRNNADVFIPKTVAEYEKLSESL